MTLATSLRKTASKLMGKFGGVATIRAISTGVYNPTTGTVSQTTSDTVVRGVLEDVSVREVNDLIQATDKRLIVAALDLNGTIPTTADEVVISGTTYQVIRVTTIEQDNTPITYELILRA